MNKRCELLKRGKEAIKNAMIPLQVRKDKNSLEKWILTKEEEVGGLEIKIEELKGAEKLDPDAILDAIDALEVVKDRLEQGEALKIELFETEVE